ncbi:MAG: hypothetical protein V4685_01345 [Bacteroidota bacterium]
MIVKTKLIATVVSFLIAVVSTAQSSKPVTEYLNVPGPLVLNKESFNLTWSSHPSANYYKQEYIGAKDKIEKFKKMLMVEVLIGEVKAADLAKAKVAELTQLKLTNPMVNHEMFQKDGEIIIDFLISDNSPDGKTVNIIERNVYRYKDITEKNGKNGVMLFAASERAYGNAVDTFLSALKKNKSVLLNAVAAFIIPQITIKK